MMQCIHGRTTKELCPDCDIGHPDNWPAAEMARTKTFHEWLTLEDVHGMILFLIEQRMGAEEGTKEFTELQALADACVAYERIMFPIGREKEKSDV
jgi:hypothetical protein